MGRHELDPREYGSRYYRTRTLSDPTVLAERIIADLPPAGTNGIPRGVEFSIHVMGGVLLQVHVGGLTDNFTFAHRRTCRYSIEADDLVAWLTRTVETYNWTNPDDPTDRRFFSSVYLLTESDYHSAFWAAGVVRVI